MTSINEQILGQAQAVLAENPLVRLDADALASLAKRVPELPAPTWSPDLHFFDGSMRTVWYWLLFSATDFCYWPSRFVVEHHGVRYGERSGRDAMAMAWKRAFESGVPIDDPTWLRNLNEPEFRALMNLVEGEVPMVQERLHHVHALADCLLEDYDGNLEQLLASARGSAVSLVDELSKCESFRDSRHYAGADCLFLSRAQSFVTNLSGAFKGRGHGLMVDLEQLLPPANREIIGYLRRQGVIVCEPTLLAELAEGVPLLENSPAEVSLRAAAIVACHQLKFLLMVSAGHRLLPDLGARLMQAAAAEPPDPLDHRTLTTSY